jgi:hypothetical protein
MTEGTTVARMLSATRRPNRCAFGCCNSFSSRLSFRHRADRKALTRSAKRAEQRDWRREQTA